MQQPDEPVCSSKGCGAIAQWVLAWNNPKLHRPERRKAWVACDEHREHLTRFLQARGFLRETVAIGDWSGEAPPGGPSAADR